MNAVMQKLLIDYKNNVADGQLRTYLQLPADFFHYFLTGTSYHACDGKPDLLTYVLSMRGIFQRKDL